MAIEQLGKAFPRLDEGAVACLQRAAVLDQRSQILRPRAQILIERPRKIPAHPRFDEPADAHEDACHDECKHEREPNPDRDPAHR